MTPANSLSLNIRNRKADLIQDHLPLFLFFRPSLTSSSVSFPIQRTTILRTSTSYSRRLSHIHDNSPTSLKSPKKPSPAPPGSSFFWHSQPPLLYFNTLLCKIKPYLPTNNPLRLSTFLHHLTT